MKTFTHAGDFGDCIYALPAIRAAGGGDLVLFNNGKTMFPMDQKRFNFIAPLLRTQAYLNSVSLSSVQCNSQLNEFRGFGPVDCNLADRHLLALKIKNLEERNRQWLNNIWPNRQAQVVVARSARYQNPRFPWRQVVEKYGNKIAFLGLRDEWIAFCSYVGQSVPYIPTHNLLDATNIIQGSELYIGNQTCLTAIAEGLKHGNMIVEQNREGARWSCFWQRQGLIMGWDETLDLPGVR